MNDILNELLANASAQNQQRNVSQPQTLGALKQAQVAATSANKVAALGGPMLTAQDMYAPLVGTQTGAGATSAAPLETDIRNMPTSALEQKYGYGAAAQIIANRATANNSIFADKTQQRDWSQTAGDLVSGVGLGAVNSIGGIGALGLGIVNADAGQAATTKLEDFGAFVRDNQSPALQQRRKVLAATDLMDKRDSDLQYQQDKAAGAGIIADLSRFGRGVVDGIANAIADPITLSDGVAEGSGSFLALAPVSRAANAAKLLKAAAAKDTALAAGKTIEEANAIAKGVMAKDGMAIPAAIGAMEAGGSYQGSVSEISNMTHEQLLAGSPDYAKMIADGVSPEEARTSVANKAGLLAAAITAPFAVAAGSLVKGFEGNPLKMGAGKVAAINMGKETIEEGSQGVTGAIAQNFGIQTFADSNKTLSDGVGEQGGRGALYGLGTAGVMAAPSVVASATKGVAGSALDFVINRADAYLEKNEANSPASINRVVETVDALVQAAPEITAQVTQALAPNVADTPEVAANKASAIDAFTSFTTAINISDDERNSDALKSVTSAISNSKTRPEAILNIITDLKKETNSNIIFSKAIALQTLLNSTMVAAEILGPVDEKDFPPDIAKLWDSINNIQDAMMKSPEVIKHLENVNVALQTEAAQAALNNPVQTPETASMVILAAETGTGKTVANMSSAAPKAVLKMAQDGKLKLTDTQKASLQSAVTLMETAEAFDAELLAQGVPKLRDIVSVEIKTEDDPGKDTQGTRSALQHARNIASLAIRGDMAGAKAALEALGNFAEGQSNKVTGINQHYAAGKGAPHVSVKVASFKGGMTDIKTPVGVTPTKEGSINHAKRVTAEARFLTNMHNLLNETYNLGVTPLPIVELDAALADGRTADIVADFNNGKRGYPQQQTLTPAAVTPAVIPPATTGVTPAAPVVKAKKERKPKAVKEPKPLKISKAVKASKTAKLQERLNTEKRPAILEQIKAELALRENTPTTETPSVTQAPETIQAKPNQTTKEAGTSTAIDKVKDTDTSVVNSVPAVNTPTTAIKPTIVPNVPSLTGQAIAAASMVTPPAAPKTVEEAYPKLLNQGETSFSKAFSLRKNLSRFFGSVSPIEALTNALSSTEAMIAFVGSTTTKHSLTPLAQTFYRETLPDLANKIVDTLEKRLNGALTGTRDFASKSPLGDLFINPTMSKKGELNIPQDMVRGRVFNIAEMDATGVPVYNQNLLESAVLGSLSWFMTSGNDGPKYDASEVAAALGISTDDVSQALVDQFNSGDKLIKLDVIGRMSAHITDFWGMKPNNDFSQTATVGIPQAVATEILRAMEKTGLVSVSEIPRPGGGKGIETFTLNHDKLGKDYTSYPSFLGEMANSEIQEAMYFGDDRPPTRTTQMGSSFIDLTEDQQQMVENEQNVVHKLNMPVVNMYKALGKDRLLDLFGVAYLDENSKNLYNAVHLESIEGQNLSIVGAYESLMGRVAAITSAAEAAGVEAGELAVRMPHEIAKNGRLFMRGAYNEQASKVTREAMMPTRSILDLSNETVLSDYMASLAQMLGVKVHNLTRVDAVNKATGIFNDALDGAVQVMSEFLTTGEFTSEGVATIKEFLHGVGNTNMALHALLEYAGYLEAKGIAGNSPLTEHVSNIYMEADGVANGPTNAMLLFSTGKFTEANLINMAKGGMFFTPGMTMNTHRGDETNPNRDKVDLYQDGASNLKEEIAALKQDLALNSANTEPSEHLDSLLRLMQEFLGDISFDENNNIQINRGTIKNPMMITIYGSGINGIAGDILEELLQAIYVRMSEALQAQNDRALVGEKLSIADAMFVGKDSSLLSTEALYKRFVADFGKLTKKKVVYNKKDEQYQAWNHKTDSGVYSDYVVLPSANSTNYVQALKSFKIKGAEWGSMRENMALLFVKPMRIAINTSLGSDVLAASKLIQTATNVQSLAMQFAFKEAVTEAMAKSGRRGGMYISKNEQAVVMKELIKKFPMIANAGQQFLIAKSSQSTVSAAAFSASLAGDLQMMALVNAPAASGVAGGPTVVIGYGDSLMMQTHSLMDGAIKNVLRIFDGMHMPVDKIMEGSRQINEAVHKTWQNNPLRDVATSFKKARPAIDSAIYPDYDKGTGILDMEDSDALMKALNLRPKSTTTVEEALNAIQAELDNAADQHEARIVAMSKFAQSIDQMAAAGASYQYAGKDISMLTLEAQAAILEEERKQALVRIKARHKAQTTNSEELKAGAVGTKVDKPLTNIVQIPRIVYTFEGMLTEIRKLPADLQETAKQALRSPAMRDYVIIVASPDDINAETGGLLGSSNGVTDVENKRIYIASTNPEVWVHELVHAATFEKVQSVLNGTNKDKMTIAAVERLQALRDQFKIMSSDQVTWTIEQVRAYREATNSMATALQEYGEAAELNELMAWATTNSALIEVGKATPATFRAFEKFTRSIVNTIRRIFFGSSPDKLPRDFFNAVRFNTALIATRDQPTATEEMQDMILRHTNSYGNDARLNQLESTYISLVAPLFKGVNNLLQKTNVNYYASNLVVAVETAFPMSHQERSTFHTIVAALATEAKINPASIAKAQELYNHVTKQLEVEDFMSNPELQDPVDRYYAQEKYDVIMGKTGLVKDNLGRSSLMPVFLALASTNDDFRAILSKMDMPAGTKNIGTTLDVYMRNTGTHAMEMLSDRLSGVKSTDSVKQAIDGLQNNIMAIVAEKATVLGSLSNKFGNLVDSTNNFTVNKLGDVATAGVALGNKMKKSNIKAVSTAGSIVRVLSGSMSDKTSAFMAEGLLSAMNSRNGLQPLRDFANDMLGRVASNANIYDMIKQVRSTVAAVRQEFRENVPTKLAKTFKVAPTDEVWTELTRAMGKTDMAALDMPFTDIVELVRNKAQTAREIKTREDAIRTEAGNATVAATYLLKAKQLANFMKTGVVGNNLYRNAPAIALKVGGVFGPSSPTMIKNIDELVSLYALRDMEQNERNAFNSLAQDEGLEFTFMYLKQQRADETAKALQHKGSKLNHYKGYIPSVQSSGMSLIVADDSQDAQLKAMSYVRVGDYIGAGAEGSVVRRGYYFNNAPTRGTFNQGIMQNVNITANGVGAVHGFTQGLTAGVITDPIYVAKLFKRINAGAEKGTNEHLMPIFDDLGGVIAYERSVDPVQLERLQSNNKLHQMLGVWRGRQVEEAMANEVNNKLVDNMIDMYQKASASDRKTKYVNIFDPKDKVLADALKLMPADVRDYMKSTTGNSDEFWVRRDMVFDAFGYRAASVGDAWTGNSRWSDETQKVFQKVALGVMGNQAFSILLKGEKFIQGFMSDARTTIVVKSVIVPALNLISNLGQLVARGVPVKDVLRKSPAKTAEIEAYVKNRLRQVDAEAELRAAKTNNEKLKLEAEIQSLKDAQRRLTIWPLIEAGEFTAISDVGLTHDDLDLSQGRWHQFIEKKVDKLPEAVRNAGRYAYITKDTALFQGLQKAVQYGDFLAKAIMYDDMTIRQNKTPAEALARITEEFVNYDRLPGRFRGYLEEMGMLWFYNFKLRSSKVAISMMRNNPVHALMSNFMPVPDVFGPVGSPLEDNFLAKAVSGTLGYSIGPGMGFRAPTMNPWWQMVN